jgi:hypothetical protein
MAGFSWSDYGAMMRLFGRLADPDPTPMLEEWEGIIRDDNRRGILAGQDKDGNPMVPVAYRPRGEPKKANKRQKNGAGIRGIFSGLGPAAAGLHNNLTSREYRKLGGPPLAPRGPNSRVITNLVTDITTKPVGGIWAAFGYWDEVVSTRGVPFLMAHFTGAATGRGGRAKLPARDLRGVRPWGRNQAVLAMQRWGRSLLAGTG